LVSFLDMYQSDQFLSLLVGSSRFGTFSGSLPAITLTTRPGPKQFPQPRLLRQRQLLAGVALQHNRKAPWRTWDKQSLTGR